MAKGKYSEWLEPDGLLKLEGWARDGSTDEQIAQKMGIDRRTLTDWKRKYDPISLALKRGKEVIDIEVENALLKRALGYSYIEKKVEKIPVEGGTVERVTTTEKEVVPDTTAQIFWLKNRKPEAWRDKQIIDNTAEANGLGMLDETLKTVKELMGHEHKRPV